MNKKTYIQFSKRVVIAVCIAVTLLSVTGVILSYTNGEMDNGVDVIKVYIQYAMVVFAAYSGNSAVEKWLVKRWGAGITNTEDSKDKDKEEDDEADNG